MDKSLKLAAVTAMLLAGSGVFYYFVVALPGIERDKQEKIEAAEQAKRLAYSRCIVEVEQAYTEDWANACEGVATQRAACMKLGANLSDRRIADAMCSARFPEADTSGSCRLPGEVADSLNDQLEVAKQMCLNKANAGL